MNSTSFGAMVMMAAAAAVSRTILNTITGFGPRRLSCKSARPGAERAGDEDDKAEEAELEHAPSEHAGGVDAAEGSDSEDRVPGKNMEESR